MLVTYDILEKSIVGYKKNETVTAGAINSRNKQKNIVNYKQFHQENSRKTKGKKTY